MVNFALISSRRSGSTLLTMSLWSHPHITMFGELFNEELAERQRSFAVARLAKDNNSGNPIFYKDGDDGAAFLHQQVYFFNQRVKTNAVGFKLLYDQANTDFQATRAWTYLIAHKNIHIIHVTRSNLLRSFVSLKLAHLTGEWVRYKGASTQPKLAQSIEINPHECEAYFARTLSLSNWVKKSFHHHATFEIQYERDICGNFHSTMQGIQAFLQVPQCPMEPLLEKQEKIPLSQRIINYNQLKAYFTATPYRNFL